MRKIIAVEIIICIISTFIVGMFIGATMAYGLNCVLVSGIIIGAFDAICSGIAAYKEVTQNVPTI